MLWPEHPPADPSGSLSALLSKLRRAVGADRIRGRGSVELRLPEELQVDVESAVLGVEQAEAAVVAGDSAAAAARARTALDVLEAELLPGVDGPWTAACRRDAEELRLRALQAACRAALDQGGDPGGAQALAREIVRVAPFRESGHVLLMRALAQSGDAADALRAYEALRVRLRDELGAVPGPEAQALHRRLLAAD
jgi:DNA-binding SARP family transcriptional activator